MYLILNNLFFFPQTIIIIKHPGHSIPQKI